MSTTGKRLGNGTRMGNARRNQVRAEKGAIGGLQRNVLPAWNQFDDDKPMSDHELQEYQSVYIETWRKVRESRRLEASDIVEELRFEVELVKMDEVNIDYILRLVQKYHDGNCKDKEIVRNIGVMVRASSTF